MPSIIERAEAPIHELTFNAIVTALDKYPRKKPLFKEFCHEYKLLSLDEFTEALALEVLELIDDNTYTLTVRAKRKYEIEQKKAALIDAVTQYLADNDDIYIILSQVEDCWLLAKKVHLSVFSRNDNSVFQPTEVTIEKEYFIIAAVKTAEEFVGDELIDRFISRGCKQYKIYNDYEVRSKFESIR